MQVHKFGTEADPQKFPIELAATIIAFLPLLFVLMTWDLDGVETAPAFAIRYLSVPVVIGEIAVVLLAVSGGLEIGRTFDTLSKASKFLIGAWAVFAIVAVLRAGEQLPLSMFTTVRYALHILFFAAVTFLLRKASNFNPDRLLTVFTIGGAAYVIAISSFALIVPDKDAFPWVLRMPSGTNIRQIGYYAAIMAVAPLALTLFAKRGIWLSAASFALMILFVSWTGSRGAILGMLFGTVAAVLFCRNKPTLKRVMLAFGLFSAGIGASIALPNPTPEFGLIRMVDSTKANDISSGRVKVWTDTLNEIVESPFVGHGAGTFSRNMKTEYGFELNHPHQVFLQYAYDWGLIGAIALLILLALLFRSILQAAHIRNDAAGFAALASFLSIFAVALIDGALFYPLSITVALATIALGVVVRNDDAVSTPVVVAEAVALQSQTS